MKRISKSLLLIFGFLCLGFTSCVDSDNPLSDPKQSTIDPGLSGVWRLREKEGDTVYYHLGRAGDKFPAGMLRVKGITHDKNGELPHPDNDDMLVFTTTLGKNHYLNITSISAERIKSMGDAKWEPSMADGYFIYKYEISGDKLTIAGMDSDQKEAAIKAGKIKGVIESKEGGGGKRFTDTTENLAKFIAAADQEKLFPTKDASGDTFATLERVK
jgi:hypothetical protein